MGVGGNVTNSNIFTGDIKIEAPVTSARHQLRPPAGDFVGREPEIDTLINALRRESRACITGISGKGGIGKTELALLVAERPADASSSYRERSTTTIAVEYESGAHAILHAEQALVIHEQIEDPNVPKVRAQLAAWRGQTNT